MEILLTLVTVMTIFNTLLTIGIAGSVAKLIKSTNDEDDQVDRQKWAQMLRARRALHLKEGNSATYADAALVSPPLDNKTRGWDGMPRSKNWDGLPVSEE